MASREARGVCSFAMSREDELKSKCLLNASMFLVNCCLASRSVLSVRELMERSDMENGVYKTFFFVVEFAEVC